MRRCSISLVLVLALALACDAGSASTPDEQAVDTKDTPATPEPPAATPESPPATPEPPAATPEPSDAPAVALTPAQLTPGVEPPANAEIQRIARDANLESPAIAAKPIGFGPHRYVVAVRTQVGDPAHYKLQLLALERSEADPPTWTLAGRQVVFEWAQEEWMADYELDPGKIPTTMFVEDYEPDGEAEVMIRYRYDKMMGGGGQNTFTDMAVLNLDPDGISEAFSFNLHHTVTVFETKGKARFEDLDQDGHPDLIIESRDFEEGKRTEIAQHEWLWDEAKDAYVSRSGG